MQPVPCQADSDMRARGELRKEALGASLSKHVHSQKHHRSIISSGFIPLLQPPLWLNLSHKPLAVKPPSGYQGLAFQNDLTNLHECAWMHMLPFTKIHLVELAIEIFSTNQEITTAAVSSLRTGTSDTSDFTEYLSANWNLFLKCTLLYFSMTKMSHTALLTEWLQTPTKGLPILYQVQKHFMAACISNICWGEENNVVCGGRKQKPLSCIDKKKLSNCPLFSTLGLSQHHWFSP